MEFFTLGVYNSTEKDFFSRLIKNKIDTFCDVRQRRGVRGAKYSFVNSKKLQLKLAELNIKYCHILDLAPTEGIRKLQKEIDIQKDELKTQRKELGNNFINEYKNLILKNFDFKDFLEKHNRSNSNRIVFFCVENYAKACHRSIVADELINQYKFKVTHL